jgi:hypothetical protein
VTKYLIPSIESDRVSAQEPFHARDKVCLRRFHQEMEVRLHQAIGMDLPTGLGASRVKCSDKRLAVLLVAEDRALAIPPAHHVVNRACILDSWFPRHFAIVAIYSCIVNTKVRPLKEINRFLGAYFLPASVVETGIFTR